MIGLHPAMLREPKVSCAPYTNKRGYLPCTLCSKRPCCGRDGKCRIKPGTAFPRPIHPSVRPSLSHQVERGGEEEKEGIYERRKGSETAFHPRFPPPIYAYGGGIGASPSRTPI